MVGTFAAVVCWMMASGKLQAEFATNKASIEGKFGDMRRFPSGVTATPASTPKSAKRRRRSRTASRHCGKKLFEAQREEVLKWPEKQLGSDFVQEIDQKKFDADQPADARSLLELHQDRFDGLLEIADAKKLFVEPTTFGATAGMRNRGRRTGEAVAYGPDGMPLIEEDFLVQWPIRPGCGCSWNSPACRRRDRFGSRRKTCGSTRRCCGRSPTRTRNGATRPDNAAIRVIQSLEVGASGGMAMSTESTILMPVDAGAAANCLRKTWGRRNRVGGRAESLDAMLLTNRYIDAEGKPIADASTGADGVPPPAHPDGVDDG